VPAAGPGRDHSDGEEVYLATGRAEGAAGDIPAASKGGNTMKRLTIIFGLLILAGCYTQLATFDRPSADNEAAAADTTDTAAVQKTRTKTVVVRERETCYWTRNFWGEPVLKCSDTYYSDNWFWYDYDPWWNSRYNGYYYSSSRCPPYYYYDPYTGYCRHRDDYYRSYNYYGGSGGGSASPAPRTTMESPRRPRGYGVPEKSEPSSGSGKTGTYTPAPQRSVPQAAPVPRQPVTGDVGKTAPAPVGESGRRERSYDGSRPPVRQEPAQPPPPSPEKKASQPKDDQPITDDGDDTGTSGDENTGRRNPRKW